MVYGGTIAPGHYKGQDLNIVSAFEALGQKIAGHLSEEEFKGIIQHSFNIRGDIDHLKILGTYKKGITVF